MKTARIVALLAAPLIAASFITLAAAQSTVTTSPVVACTADAKVCPDGTTVGRTGPNCAFVCPGADTSNACIVPQRDLARGSRSSDVLDLQTALSEQGYFTAQPIGVFGPMTLRALIAFQRANGVPQTGFFGPLTRAALIKRCGTVPPISNNVRIYSITPVSGPVGTEVTIDGFGFTNDNTIHFGTGVIPHVAVSGQIAIACTTDPSCVGGIHQSLKFTVPTGLNPACFYSNPRCMVLTRQTTPGNYDVTVENSNGTSNAKTFTVTGETSGSARIDSISPSSGPVGTTVTLQGAGFSPNMILRFAEGSVPFNALSDSQLTFTVPESVGPYCAPQMMCAMYMRIVSPGTYDVYLQNTDGSWQSNKTSFTVASGGSGTISINGLDSPTTLPMGMSGTWTVHAAAGTQFPNLHYSVTWGDENMAAQAAIMAPPPSQIQTSATFMHAYSRAGTFTPTFTVSDDAGHSATVSATVTVTPWY
ncbi:MAG: IPT/TIG domain-containing protein [Candidatus Kaiserbacteria bacterium]|nr:IPT/TIG domain-containing protein [Candidatus Kaiserbacteria bacterium]